MFNLLKKYLILWYVHWLIVIDKTFMSLLFDYLVYIKHLQ